MEVISLSTAAGKMRLNTVIRKKGCVYIVGFAHICRVKSDCYLSDTG